ncbi:HupE/UreJ family protein [Urechidicola croceus]|uniref:HupE / UreJ protein n=1 Tax=Urechidicola croceus TaxID=1850246 RepID=A0A1D8P9N4_9FLAO|nr:HupE/UreJ family protein [Urechidicola croceus]AOW21292.1 HupE / UreJ protein [Urechidicola croceus]
MNEFLYFFKEGFFHVFDWKAYDHLLFLIVLTVVYSFNDWKKVIWLITLFTIGHSLTLLLSIYDVIRVNTRIVEFLIPLTILIVAIFNVFTAGKTSRDGKNNLNMIFALFFGLIHGLAFAGGFERIVGSNNKLLSLLEFGLGIEASQVVAAIIILFLGFIFQTVFRFSKRDWTLVISSIVIGLVIPMLIANKIW